MAGHESQQASISIVYDEDRAVERKGEAGRLMDFEKVISFPHAKFGSII